MLNQQIFFYSLLCYLWLPWELIYYNILIMKNTSFSCHNIFLEHSFNKIKREAKQFLIMFFIRKLSVFGNTHKYSSCHCHHHQCHQHIKFKSFCLFQSIIYEDAISLVAMHIYNKKGVIQPGEEPFYKIFLSFILIFLYSYI